MWRMLFCQKALLVIPTSKETKYSKIFICLTETTDITERFRTDLWMTAHWLLYQEIKVLFALKNLSSELEEVLLIK